MKIKVFSTPTCPYCNMAKEFLTEKGAKYTDVNVATNAAARDEMVQKSGQMGVPVIVITKDDKETIIVGFDRAKIEAVLS